VRLARDERELAVDVDDSGTASRAFAPVGGAADGSGGYGLMGLRERAAAVGGVFAAGPTQGGGFRVTATLPVPATEPEDRR
jgi:signal transduction histidine kinase